jgi:hypothetical protein
MVAATSPLGAVTGQGPVAVASTPGRVLHAAAPRVKSLYTRLKTVMWRSCYARDRSG